MAVVAFNQSMQMLNPTALRSMILVECGSVWTRAMLLGMAEGHSRLLSIATTPTTAVAPFVDISLGAKQAIQQIEALTGRHLFAQGQLLTPETESGDGVDGLGIVTNVGGPLQILAVGPGLVAAAPQLQRAIATVSVEVRTLNADTPLFQVAETAGQRTPHAIIIFGTGTDEARNTNIRQALEESTRASLAITGPLGRNPTLLCIGGYDELTIVRQAANGRDVLYVEPNSKQTNSLTATLTQLYEQLVLDAIPGFQQLRALATIPPISSTAGLGRAIRFFAQRYSTNATIVNVGATNTLLLNASAQGSLYTIQSPLQGTRQGAGSVLRKAGVQNILRWIPFPMSEFDLKNAILQRMLTPRCLPELPIDLAIDQALARESIRLTAVQDNRNNLAQYDVIIGTGGTISQAPQLAQSAFMLLDSLQPVGVSNLIIDSAEMLTMLGGASLLDRIAAADTVDIDALQIQLGTCISSVGVPPPGQPAMRVILEYADGRQHTTEVLYGTIELLPLGLGQRARLLIYPSPGVDIGLGPGQSAQGGEQIEGGRLGVIVDARGRPLVLPSESDQRIAILRQWYGALGL